jgi:hypothetical protein
MVEKYYIELKNEEVGRLKEIVEHNGYYQSEMVKAARRVLKDRGSIINTP